ncbi:MULTISPECIES: RecQ family ATP-dependent DNA helicase [Leptospira]|uniref:ATP-dependent DNA helicase RecQ n=2 Tax=Leptospira santarosai TaxID=28183 RepID=A0AB73LLG0_9LEPT|nr:MULTISPECIES: RecQ family ATP-dependent DNA helicase [Leptospira]EKO78379.1 DEAD/DEAH box helicase [Leptospira sp. Fiocruz LV3954]EKS09315.1 DEAD/DEAH box helicase [Leptospira santarosai str. JET]EMF88930.1 DEAD/DEAH box helicase [Leptospira santarosai str. ST188]EMI61654.1 DEAD/DEAH box helicase [Leptospira sp. Fiocruz LV4135]EMM87777.1 DEAD/DEAH box helicase [Leptospira santarosai str. 2000027870]
MASLSQLKTVFGITTFRSSQEGIISDVLSGRNCLVVMPTGMGKSICYQLPSLALDGLTVVISPLIALMQDQVSKLKRLGIDAGYINSSLSKQERLRCYLDLKEGRYKIVYVSPERFRKKEFIDSLRVRKVSLLAIDEAHCISQWGHDFRPDYTKIAEFRDILGKPTMIALTATATLEIQKDIVFQMGLQESEVRVYNEGICRPNLFLDVRTFVDEPSKSDSILELLKKQKGSTIVYFNLIRNLEKFGEKLDVQKIPHEIYHGRLSPERRKKVQNRFLESEDTILLATNAFGMGVDKPNIRTIIHAELPSSLEGYYQEIGRAGRDGNASDCHVFYNQDDLTVLMDFIEWQNPDVSFIARTYQTMERLGEKLCTIDYEELQSMVVHKNRGDHRLQTVLNLFERYGVTSGELEKNSLKLKSPLPDVLRSSEFLERKKKTNLNRLYQMFLYLKSERCRREFVYKYFDAKWNGCGNCDVCKSR